MSAWNSTSSKPFGSSHLRDCGGSESCRDDGQPLGLERSQKRGVLLPHDDLHCKQTRKQTKGFRYTEKKLAVMGRASTPVVVRWWREQAVCPSLWILIPLGCSDSMENVIRVLEDLNNLAAGFLHQNTYNKGLEPMKKRRCMAEVSLFL